VGVRISFITFTRNSGRRLGFLLESVRDVVDEIIVVDGYSNDDTVEIAESYGAKVFQRKPWGHVEPDRMFALSKASYDWILYLDDDEVLGRRLKSELRDLVSKAESEGIAAFSTARVNYDVGCRQILFGSAYPDRQIRIYRKDKVLYRGLVHELPIVYGKLHKLPEEYFIIHYETRSKSKMLLYAYLESIERYKHHTRPSITLALLKLMPLSSPILILFNLVSYLLIKDNPYLNLCTVLRTIDTFSYYQMLVYTLMKFRGRRRTRMSKLISQYGLIKLLEHEVENTQTNHL
jgi:glycosyltransferase involved in cell wall biosynthesis